MYSRKRQPSRAKGWSNEPASPPRPPTPPTPSCHGTRHIPYTDHINQRLLRAFLIIRASNYSQILIGALLGISGMILHSNWPSEPHRIYEFQFARCRYRCHPLILLLLLLLLFHFLYLHRHCSRLYFFKKNVTKKLANFQKVDDCGRNRAKLRAEEGTVEKMES